VNLLTFVVELTGATMLLLYAVRMVRTGIERAFGASFRRYVTTTTSQPTATITGLFLAVILQSSAAVALLVAGFAGSGALSFASGLPMILGADLGSALVIQVLSFNLEWLIPALLAIGGLIFIKSDRRTLKQAGRIILGIAFILISLRFLRETMLPIRESDFLPAIASYLESDYLTAFIIGAVLTFVMHSSVATILMCVTIVSIDALPVSAAISLVLGANLGSALIPVWLGRGMNVQARRLPVANLIIRGSGAILALMLVSVVPLPQWLFAMGNAQALINIHIIFNCALIALVPLCHTLEKPISLLWPDEKEEESFNPVLRAALDDTVLDKPILAITCLQREVLRMAQVVEGMVSPVMELYHEFDLNRMKAIRAQDTIVNNALDDIKRYAASIPAELMDKEQSHKTRDLTEYAIALESAGDIVCKQLLVLAQEKSEQGVRLSRDGSEELEAMHQQMLSNLTLAMNLLVSGDMEHARLMLEEKTEMVRQERGSRKKHLKRLSSGSAVSFDSSNIHLETLRALNQFNSRITTLAYPILYRGGQLLETRLIENLDSADGRH
jgi:phosphate:Na+ symporter